MNRQTSPIARARRSLVPYTVAIIVASGLLQVVIALRGNRIDLVSALLLAVIALGYAIYLLTAGKELGQVRYGRLVAHAVTYVVVNTGFLLHAYVLIAVGSPAINGAGAPGHGIALDPNWLGATLGMASFWGLGLLMHALGALASRGFESARA